MFYNYIQERIITNICLNICPLLTGATLLQQMQRGGLSDFYLLKNNNYKNEYKLKPKNTKAIII